MTKPAIPADSYVQVGINQISEGGLVRQIDESILRAVDELLRWEQAMNRRDGAASITVKIKFKRSTNEFMNITASVATATPNVPHESIAKMADGLMLCQLEGTGENDPTQMRLFDFRGRPKGVLDTVTGELIDEQTGKDGATVAGKIAADGA